MKTMRKRNIIFIFVILLLCISIGFAYINGLLKINGIANVSKQTWDVYFDNVQVTTGSVTPISAAQIVDSESTKVAYSVELDTPGDFYEFTVDAVNNGSIDAMISSVEFMNKVTVESQYDPLDGIPGHIRYSITYADGVPLGEGHILPKKEGSTPTVETYRVRIEFRNDIDITTLNQTEVTNLTLNFEVMYEQADESAILRPTMLQDDNWNTIAVTGSEAAKQITVSDNKCGPYNVGDTKTFQMDLDGDSTNETYTVRIANCSTPTVCSDADFSQAACGFVLEFTNVISTHRMNPYDTLVTADGNGNKGSWEYSDMRAYLNGTIYTYENINYSTNGVYSKLPQDLKSVIIDTKIVTGYGQGDSSHGNYTTTDKLYLLDVAEVYSPYSTNCTAETSQRQLDYYNSFGVITMSNCEAAIKNNLSTGLPSSWALRSPSDVSYGSFYNVNTYGSWHRTNGDFGVSPAFRISK